MIKNLVICKANNNDLQSIINLYAQKDMDNGIVLDIKKAEEIFNKFSAYPNYSLYIAKTDYTIVGAFALLIMDNLAHLGMPSGVVEDVVVHEKYRSLGIGKQMMEYAIKVCRENGCYKMT